MAIIVDFLGRGPRKMRHAWCLILPVFGLMGCDGQDADRLNRVGKKVVEKSRAFANRMKLPQVEIQNDRHQTTVRGDETNAEKK